jgi:hypothetical protein
MAARGFRRLKRLFWLTVMVAGGCAASNVLGVNYQLPSPAAGPLGRSATIAFSDERQSTEFLTRDARNELEGFTGVYALTVSEPGRGGELKGAYPLDALCKEVMRYRLENAGLRVLAPPAAADAEIRLVLKVFRLDFGDRKWTSTIDYEAQLVKNGSVVSRQVVNGSAERMMFMKKADAEKVVGELLSDAVNKLDVALLFRQAGM